MPTLSLTIVEIIVLMLGAIVLGITIHFFIVSRRNLRSEIPQISKPKISKASDEWKTKYFNDIEMKDKELASLRQLLEDEKENNNINVIEAEEQRQRNKELKEELAALKLMQATSPTISDKPDFSEQLSQTQRNLLDQNERLSHLLSQIEALKGAEEKQEQIKQENEELAIRVEELELKLFEKEKEVNSIRQKANLTKEMSSMLDNAYNEFQVLQSKIQKLESQTASSGLHNMDLENLKEENIKLGRELEENKQRLNAATSDNHELRSQLATLAEELKETAFQRQQAEKKLAYLEEMNNDLQAVSDANKKLEGQIKRIGELESMLNMLAEERDQLIRRQTNQ
jgi:predicted  nucleic acid-binding Zn-ribbon protein